MAWLGVCFGGSEDTKQLLLVLLYAAPVSQQWPAYFLGHMQLGAAGAASNSWICLSFAGCRLAWVESNGVPCQHRWCEGSLWSHVQWHRTKATPTSPNPNHNRGSVPCGQNVQNQLLVLHSELWDMHSGQAAGELFIQTNNPVAVESIV